MKNYFLALYDIEDNYIRDFDSIEECANYFKTTNDCIRQWICKKRIRDKKYKLFKIDNSPVNNI